MLSVPPVPALDPASFSPGASHQQPTLSLGTGTIVAGPDRLLDLVRPVTIDGMLTSDPSTGLMSLQTSMGQVTVQPNGALPPGQAVTAQITPGNPPTVTLTTQQTGAQQTVPQQAGAPSVQQTTVQQIPAQSAAVIVPTSAANGATQPGQIITAIPIPAGSIPVGTAVPANAANPTGAAILTENIASPAAGLPAANAPPIQSLPAQPLPAQTSSTPTPASPHSVQIPLPPAFPPQASILPSNLQTTAMPSLSGQPPPPLPIASNAGTAEIFFTAAPASVVPVPAQLVTSPAAPYSQFSSLIQAQAAATQPIGTPANQGPAQPATVAPQAAVQSAATLADTQTAPFTARVASIIPPGVQSGSVTPQPVTGAITGIVTGATLSGQPILQTQAGSFILQTAGPLPPGTQVTLAPPGTPTPVALLPAPPLDVAGGKTWPVLSQSLQVLAAAQPALADAIRLAMPQAGPLMAPLLMLFVGSMRNGGTRTWLGDKVLDALKHAGRPDLADALSADLDSIGRRATMPTPDGWRTIPIPLMLQGELGRLQLYLRPYPSADEKGGPAEEDERTGTRFLIEVEPSAVGPIQLDGLVRSTASYRAPLLDMILRSRLPIPQDMQRDIAMIYNNSLSASGLKGGIIFQGAGNWVTVGRSRKAPQHVTA